MARSKQPFSTPKRRDSKTYLLTLNPSCGLPHKICLQWQRRSFQNFPGELALHRSPKNKTAAQTAALLLIEYLKKKNEEGGARKISIEDTTVGVWLEKFTDIETSPRTGINTAKNRPPSIDTLDTYKSYFNAHIKNDLISKLKMTELEETDVLEFSNRLAYRKKEDGNLVGGTRTHAGVIIFMRMAFKNYQKKFPKWYNPFVGLDPPVINNGVRDFLPEEEFLKLFYPGVLKTTMELAVCACMFLSGLRRAEIAALMPEDLSWHTRSPKIVVRRAWQAYDKKRRVLGPPKGKKHRDAPFDPILQEAIKKLWQENGQHEWVFSFDGRFLNSQWIRHRFPRWLKDAGIELNGRKIVPHSSRHSLASLLEEKGVSLRYIQELLGHSDLETTKIYLHSTEKTIRGIGEKITEAREKH